MKAHLFKIILISLCAALLLIQELLMVIIPNVQFTMLFIFIYSKKMKLKDSLLTIFVYVLLDSIISGGFNLIYFPFMLIGWSIVPICLNTVFKKVNESMSLSFVSILFSLIYSWLFIIPGVFILKMSFLVYLQADLIWEIILCVSSFLSVLWLYNPLANVFDKLLQRQGYN